MNSVQCVYLVDSDKATQGLVRHLAEAMGVESQIFASAEQFLEGYQRDRPGCVVSEFRLAGMDGLELQDQLARAGCRLPIVFLSAHATLPFAVRAMREHAVGVLEKPATQNELWEAVSKALRRDREVRQRDTERARLERRFEALSHRERAVLELLVEGKPNKSIAHELDISVRTVETCRGSIFRKTETSSIAEVVGLSLDLKNIIDRYPHKPTSRDAKPDPKPFSSLDW